MMTDVRPKQVTEDVALRILNQMEASLDKWGRLGYCPCCIAKNLLLSAGLLAAHELQTDDLREVLGEIASQGEKHALLPDDTPRH